MRNLYLVIVWLTCSNALGQGSPGADFGEPLPLYYDVATGNATIDLTNVSGGITAAHIADTGSTSLRSDQIVEVSWEGIPSGNHVLGPILPSGLSLAELLNVVESAQFLGQPGHDVASFDLESSGIGMSIRHIVPEPTSASVVGFICLLFIGVSRCRKPRLVE